MEVKLSGLTIQNIFNSKAYFEKRFASDDLREVPFNADWFALGQYKFPPIDIDLLTGFQVKSTNPENQDKWILTGTRFGAWPFVVRGRAPGEIIPLFISEPPVNMPASLSFVLSELGNSVVKIIGDQDLPNIGYLIERIYHELKK